MLLTSTCAVSLYALPPFIEELDKSPKCLFQLHECLISWPLTSTSLRLFPERYQDLFTEARLKWQISGELLFLLQVDCVSQEALQCNCSPTARQSQLKMKLCVVMICLQWPFLLYRLPSPSTQNNTTWTPMAQVCSFTPMFHNWFSQKRS